MHGDRYTVSRQGGAGSMQAIKNKIRSRRGASLTFALLLFLVCAVVGSVVLVAGMAASRRLIQIAEMDQRYYSVNSAARLLIDLMGENHEIRTEKKTVGSETKTIYYIDGTEEKDFDLTQWNYKLALGIVKQIEADTAEETALSFTLGPETVPEGAKLNVNITATLTGSDHVEFVVKSSENSERYQITLRFMDTVGAFKYKWKLYDIESTSPLSATP